MKKNSRTWKILASLEPREPSQVLNNEFNHIFGQDPTHSTEAICNANIEEINNNNNSLSPCPQTFSTELTATLENVSLSVFDEPGPSPTKYLTTLENVSLIALNEDLYLSHSSNDSVPAPDECILSSSDFSTSETRNKVKTNDVMIQDVPHSDNRGNFDINIKSNTTDIAGVGSVIPGHQNRKRKRRGQADPRFYTIIRKASRKNPYDVLEMGTEDFVDIKYLKTVLVKNAKVDSDRNSVNWLKIRWLQYRKEDSKHIYFKYELDDNDFKMIEIIRRGKRLPAEKISLKNAYDKPLPISAEKYEDLQDLCRQGIIPTQYHSFYVGFSFGTTGDDEDT